MQQIYDMNAQAAQARHREENHDPMRAWPHNEALRQLRDEANQRRRAKLRSLLSAVAFWVPRFR